VQSVAGLRNYAIVALVGLVVGSASAWLYVTRGHDGEIESIEQRARADSARSDSLIADVRAAYQDTIAAAEAAVETLTVRVPVAVARVDTTGATLIEHLTLREDTAGVRMFNEHIAAEHSLRDILFAQFDARLRVKNLQIAERDRIVAIQDSTIVNLRRDLTAALDEARRWRTKANPPLSIRVASDLPGCGLGGVYAGAESGSATTGFIAGGICLAGQELARWAGRKLGVGF
jgi:hypothetical protein